jgi:hypothetical protein
MTSTKSTPFIPKNAADALALEIAQQFGDEANLAFYRGLCAEYPRAMVYRAFREALSVPLHKIRSSRRALFTYLLRQYDQET